MIAQICVRGLPLNGLTCGFGVFGLALIGPPYRAQRAPEGPYKRPSRALIGPYQGPNRTLSGPYVGT